jgi:hypothetical protein
LHAAAWPDLPDGAFVLLDAGPARVAGERLVPWRADNSYASSGAAVARPARGTATVVTPPSSLDALRRGYPVQVGAPAPLTS